MNLKKVKSQTVNLAIVAGLIVVVKVLSFTTGQLAVLGTVAVLLKALDVYEETKA